MDSTKLSELKVFIDQCKSDPSLLSTPSLSFFRDYLESLGAKIPTGAYEEGKNTKSKSFVVEESDQARPPGVKASKAKGKKSVSKATTVEEEGKALLEFQRMWEIKQKDLTMKERLSKIKLLDSLIAKTELLSEMEVALKDKLITDMLSNS